MIKEALQYIVKMGNNERFVIGSQEYSTQPLHLIKEATAKALEINSLSGLVEYLKSQFDTDEKLMIHVQSQTEVLAFGTLNNNKLRNEFIFAKAMLPSFNFDRFHDTEDFNIKLQSAFVQNEDRDIMLKVVGNIREDNVKQVGDDGVSQAVTAKTGVSTVSTVKVPNPVVLKPYRTFVEVDQPESDFIFRMQNGPRCALFEADGGAWKLQAMKNIRTYLQEALAEEIKVGKIVIIA